MPTNLAPVYLDDARVQLQGDPRPRVSKIVAAGGKPIDDDLVVMRLRSQADEEGSPVRLEDVIDRAQHSEPVYLRSRPRQGTPGSARAGSERPGFGSTRRQETQPQFGAARPGMAGQGAQESPGRVPPDKQAKSDAPKGNPDATQEFQSGGRQGEGMPGARVQAGIRDQSTDNAGRQQGKPAPSGSNQGTSPEPGDAD